MLIKITKILTIKIKLLWHVILVILNYNEKEYAMAITASSEENAIEFGKDECIRVVTKATGHTNAQVRENITEKRFHAVQI